MMSKMYGGQLPSFLASSGGGWWVVPDGARYNPTVYNLSGAGTGADFNFHTGLNYDNGIHWTGLGYYKGASSWLNQSYCLIRSKYPYNNSWERSQFISNDLQLVCTAKDGTILGVAPGGYSSLGQVFTPVQAWIWYPGAATAVQVNLGTELSSYSQFGRSAYWNGQQFVVTLTDGSWISVAIDGTVSPPSFAAIPGALPERWQVDDVAPKGLGARVLLGRDHPTVKAIFYGYRQTWNYSTNPPFNEFYPQFAALLHDGTVTTKREMTQFWGYGAVTGVFYFQGYWYARGINADSSYSMVRTSKNIWAEDVLKTDWIVVQNWPSANIIQPFI